MSFYSDTITERDGAVVSGASVYVYEEDGTTLATLVNQSAIPLPNPLSTDQYGNFSFVTADGYYLLDIWYGGRRRWKQQIAVGDLFGDAVLLSAPTGSSMVGFQQSGTGAVARTAQDKLRDVIDLADFPRLAPDIDDGARFFRAIAEAYARGGGVVNVPSKGSAYVIGTGLTVPEGVWVEGCGKTYHGPPFFGVDDWTDKGVWIKPTDTVNPCFTLGYGCGIRGLNFIYAQTAPQTGVAYVPTVFPYAIKCTQSMWGLDDIWIIGGTHGINVEYLAANGGGTFCWMNNIFMDTLQVGTRFKNVNDIIKITNYHHRPLWHYDSAEAQTYRNANTVGWDVNYLDNIMADGVEFLHLKTGILLTDSTCIFGGTLGSITQAIGYSQISNIQFNFCTEGVKVANGTTKGQIMMQNVLAATDLTTGAAADWFFDFGSDNMEVMISNLWANFIGRGIAKIGNGTGGYLSIGGTLRGRYSGNGTTYNAISVGAGATCLIPAGIHDVSPLSGSTAIFTGAGTPGVVRYAGHVDIPLGKEYRVNGVRVVKEPRAGWQGIAGTATRTTFDTATVTLPQLAERVKAVIDDLSNHHGLLSG